MKGLFRSAAVMAVGTALSRVTGVVRTIAIAHALGLFVIADAYNQANQTPTIIYELVVGGILSATLVPVFVRAFTDDEDDNPWQAVSAIFTIVSVVVVGLSIVVALIAPLIIDFYTSGNNAVTAGEQRDTATFLLRIFAPQVAIYGFISVATGLLNARRKFAAPMFAPVFNNLILIALFFSLPMITSNIASATVDNQRGTITWLGVATTLGVLAMAGAIMPSLLREARGNLKWNWDPKHPAVKTVIRLSGWTAGFVVANQAALAVNLVLAGSITGDTTAMLTAYTFFILPHGIYAVSVMNALQPNLAEHFARREASQYRNVFATGLRLVLFIIVPAAVGYGVLVHPVVNLVLEHGAFDSRASNLTGNVLLAMLFGLPGFSVFIYCSRALQAMQDARTVFNLYLIENGINIVASVVLHHFFGVIGLGAAQAVAYTGGAAVALVVLSKKTQGINAKSIARGTVKVIGASALMGFVLYAIAWLFKDHELVTILVGVIVGSIVYALCAFALGLDELNRFLRRRRATTP